MQITNGCKTLRNCRLTLNGHDIYKPFEMVSGGKKPCPIIRVSENNVAQPSEDKVRILQEGVYELKMHSDDLHPPLKMKIRLTLNDNEWQVEKLSLISRIMGK